MTFELKINSLNELPFVASEILKRCEGKKIFAFIGEMGAGKTTMIKSLCRVLGVNEKAVSPSFSIVNEYKALNQKIFHIDLYRLNNLNEALEIGIEEYVSGINYCFIEWPQLIQSLLPLETVSIKIKSIENNIRIVTVENF